MKRFSKQNTLRRRPTFEMLEARLALAVTVSVPEQVIEGGAVNGTVTRTGNLALPLTVALSSNDTTSATVSPASIFFSANQASALILVSGVSESVLDDNAVVTITATATGHDSGSDTITVVNDDFLQLLPAPASDVITVRPGAFDQFTAGVTPAIVGDANAWLAKFGGTSTFQTAAASKAVQADDFFPVDTAKTYALSGWARSGDELGQRYLAVNQQTFALASYDIDRQQILPEHVLRFQDAANTTLAQPLNPGDTTIRLVSANGWSNFPAAAPATRGIAWYGYADSTGHVYPNYTYTRNVALGGAGGLWAPGGIAGNVITLATPWAGPALPAGAAVRNTGAGNDESHIALDSATIPGDWSWTQHAAVFGGGELQNGFNLSSKFRPGTAFVKPVIIANEHATAENFMSWRDVTLTTVAPGATAASVALPVVDLSVITGSGQRRQLSLPQGTPYSWAGALVKVNLAAPYTLSAWSQNSSSVNEAPLGFASLDVDKKLIHPLHVTRHAAAADTTLAHALLPGANSLLLTNASGWSNEIWQSADTRALAWYGYADSTGHVYDDYTYTRNVASDLDHGLWDAGAIAYDTEAGAYRVQLRQPWSGPALAAGAAVRNAASGATLNQPPSTVLPTSAGGGWVEYRTNLGGAQWQAGQRDEFTFRPGTAYIQPVMAAHAPWTNLVISPLNNTTPLKSIQLNASGAVALDLVVHAKGAFGAASTVVIDSVTTQFGTATITPGASPGAYPAIHYRSVDAFVGTDRVVYTLRNTATNETFTAAVTIHSINNAPGSPPGGEASRIDDAYATRAGQALVVNSPAAGLLVNDLMPAGVTAQLVAGPSHGTLKLNADGTFTYLPHAGFIGTDAFRYQAVNGAITVAAYAVITVNPTNDAQILGQLRELGLGWLNYEAANNTLPNAAGMLSWHVAILPYLGYQSLYNQFHLNEAWDSPHNLPLASQMPPVFRHPDDPAGGITTRYQRIGSISGQLKFVIDLQDRMYVVETGADKAAPWTKPSPITVADWNNPLASLGTYPSGVLHAAMVDGSTISIATDDAAAALRSLAGGFDPTDANTWRRRYAESSGSAPATWSYGAKASAIYFKTIGLAMLNYESAKTRFPILANANNFDAEGRPLVSWRVHLLPFIGYTRLFNQFKLDEPWNSPNNLPLLAKMPDIYRSAGDSSHSTTTRVKTFTGPRAPFESQSPGVQQSGPSIASFADGLGNTILFMEAGPDVAVPWTKPEDMAFDHADPLGSVGDLAMGEMRVALADLTQMFVGTDISPDAFAALVTRTSTAGARREESADARRVLARELERTGQINRQSVAANRLKDIAIAMQNFESAQGRYPANTFAADGTPLLSWRVHLLPYLGLSRLYNQFRKNEPWDSPHNLALLDLMPDFFGDDADPSSSVLTRVATAPGSPFPATGDATTRGPTRSSIGSLSTAPMIVQIGRDLAIPWTKPTDLPNRGHSALGDVGPSFWMFYFDGHGATITTTITSGTAGVYARQTGGAEVTNEFGADAVDVQLTRAPTSNVVLTLGVSNPAVASLDRTTLTFTPANWRTPQRVALRGVDNLVVNADQTVILTIDVVDAQSDNNYDPLATVSVAFVVRDDDRPQRPDFDGDRRIDGDDLLAWQRGLGTTTGAAHAQGDADADGDVDAADLAAWRAQFGRTLDAAAPNADFNGDGFVTHLDLPLWTAGFGAQSAADRDDGDADGDRDVDGDDLLLWQQSLEVALATASLELDPPLAAFAADDGADGGQSPISVRRNRGLTPLPNEQPLFTPAQLALAHDQAFDALEWGASPLTTRRLRGHHRRL